MENRTGIEYAVDPRTGVENRADHRPEISAMHQYASRRAQIFMAAKCKAYGVPVNDIAALTAKVTRERPEKVKVKMPGGNIELFEFELAVDAVMVGKGELL